MTPENPAATAPLELVRGPLKSQYHATLGMLRQTIEACPDDLWIADGPTNAYWQIAYHTVYFTHLYLGRDEGAFRPWHGHRSDVQHPDAIAGTANPESPLPLIPRPYGRNEVLDYLRFCDRFVDEAVDAMDLTAAESGFSHYPVSKLEHQLVNIRHLAHHTAQLADRLRAAEDVGTRWISAG